MKFYKHILLLPVLMLSVLLSSCEDKFDYSSQIIGEGESLVQATLEFKPSVTPLGGSRTAGNAISNINTLAIVIYDAQGNFVDLIDNVKTAEYKFKDLTPTTDKPSDYPTGPNGEDISSDNATAKVQFEMKLPYGRYYMYAVANLGRALTEEEVQSIDDLKSIECTWNPNDISANAQMFGYFTNDVTTGNTAYTETDPTVTVNQKNIALHSWIKRLASKVTIAYNGSGLHNGIYVYIHNVSIRQIPLTCTLGKNNTPNAEDQVTPAAFNESVANANQALYYNGKGEIVGKTEYNVTGKEYENWMTVAKGSGILGAANHTPSDPALFFYENMQGVHPDKPKAQQKDKVGTNVAPYDSLKIEDYKDYTYEDYKDGVEYGTFIEVEAYYQCDTIPVSRGAIRYRFMLGQNDSDNYDAIRNCHYKLTLGFNGYANQPDWHIEYKEEPPIIYANEVYIPYTYNTSVEYPVTLKGKITHLTAEIIENNWAPYDENDPYEVAAASNGETDFLVRTLRFEWWRDLFINSSGYQTEVDMRTANFQTGFINSESNYFYGRHPSPFYKLDADGKEIRDAAHRYYVTPIWAGFLRLQVPEQYNDESVSLPTAIIRNLGQAGGAAQYGGNETGRPVLTRFRNYYYGSGFTPMPGDDDLVNTTDLHRREFTAEDLAETRTVGIGRNSYQVIKNTGSDGVESTTVILKLWTQPKSMCGISGFSGNNPYEDYNRKAVIRFTATFGDGETRSMDVPVLQSKRITNPKGVWRAHANPDATKTAPDPFHVILYQRDTGHRSDFTPMISQGAWTATIETLSEGASGFISLEPGPKSSGGGKTVSGDTRSEVDFTINFAGNIAATETKCALIRITYHGNTCVHNIFVRQGYEQPIQISNDGPYWSSYNLYTADGDYGNQGTVTGVQARNPLLFGAYFKRGNYRQAIAVSNISENVTAFGPLGTPGNNSFVLSGSTSRATWAQINGNTSTTGWHWANFSINGVTYEMPTIADFQTLLAQDSELGIGVLYGDGATAPATTTTAAFGFMDTSNRNDNLTSAEGMRGFICYNSKNAHQVFFPVGTSGMGRRTIQALANTMPTASRGTLRYGSVDENFDQWSVAANSMRPIPMNIVNSPGSVYWVYAGVSTGGGEYYMGWDMNYFDLNFNGLTNTAISRTQSGGGGDALPIKLVRRRLTP